MVEGEDSRKLFSNNHACAGHIPPTYPETAHRMGENLIQPYLRQELKSRIYKKLQKLSIKETKVANQQIGR